MYFGRIPFLLFALTAVALVIAESAAAQESDPTNAAYWYQQAIEKLDSFSDEELEVIGNYFGGSGEPTPELRETLRKAQPMIALLQRGAAQQYADYQLDYSKGIDLMLPHLGKLRQCAKFMSANAELRMHDGDSIGAAREFGSMYRLSEHFSDDRTMISSLVGNAVFNLAERVVQNGFDHGKFDAVASAELLKSTDQFDAQDPFGFVEDLFIEQELMVNTLEKHFSDPDKPDEMWSLIVGEGENADAFFDELRAEGVDAQIEKIDRTLNEVIEIFMIDDEEEAGRRMDEFEDRIEAGEFGAMASLIMPAYGKIHSVMLDSRKKLAARRAMLEQLAKGELDPNDILNAAVLYQQAIDAWYATDASKQSAILAIMAEPTQSIPQDVVAMLVEAEPVVDLMRKASLLKRCDFEILQRNERLSVLPSYITGMHDLLGLIRIDALRLAREKNGDDAADRLAIGYRAIGHMTSDDQLLGALVAHDAFDDLAAQLRAGLSAGLYEQNQTLLRDAVDKIARRDPFGYINAVMTARKKADSSLRSFNVANKPPASDFVSRWQGDQLLYVFIIRETLGENAERTNKVHASKEAAEAEEVMYQPLLADRLAALKAVISMDAVKAAQQDAESVMTQLSEGDFDIFSAREISSIGSWDERMRTARSDLREARRLVKAEETEDESATE